MNRHRGLRDLSRKVVVITGASSGIGRVTAHAFAREGANVVLAARRRDALRLVARECAESGVETLVVPTDVTFLPSHLPAAPSNNRAQLNPKARRISRAAIFLREAQLV